MAEGICKRHTKKCPAREGRCNCVGGYEASVYSERDGKKLYKTYASFMIAAGVNAKALSSFMGHASITVTFDLYGPLMPGSEAEGAALLDAYLDDQGDE